MSYEGYDEYICPNGHYYTCDVYLDDDLCPLCSKKYEYRHGVDQTNGVEYDTKTGKPHPYTVPAKKEEYDSEDEWYEDHHGNKYAVKIPLYEPIKHWSIRKKD